ncbi:MAG: calcineurin-like phosphoesterase C-terminal domain-containing protein [Pseudoxanthomonas sp.]
MRAVSILLLLLLAGGAFAADKPETLEVLVFADPQVKSATDVDYYRRDIVAPLAGQHHAQIGISLGDIVDDAPQLYRQVKQVDAALSVPWLYVPGNHDVDVDAVDDASSLRSFHAALGKDSHGRHEKMATFIALDDVIAMPGRKPAYIGGFREDQFAFLEAFLRTTPKDRLLVIGVHIPLFEQAGRDTFRDTDRERLFALLRDFPHVLILSAHTHNQRHFFHGAETGWHGAQPLHEYNVGAACGAFWSGVKDTEGIPDSTMSDGTPNGYARLTIKPQGEYALSWHPARDPDAVMALHAPKVLRQGAYPAWGVYANVFMGDDETQVEYRIDGSAWQAMKKVVQPDPRLLVENAKDDAADDLRGYDRSPEATPSQHLWRGALPTDLAPGEHKVEVRANGRWLGERIAGTTYRLQPASP